MTEQQHQTYLVRWSQQPSIRGQYPELAMLFHIPNERSDKVQASILKRMGVKKGVPDLFPTCSCLSPPGSITASGSR